MICKTDLKITDGLTRWLSENKGSKNHATPFWPSATVKHATLCGPLPLYVRSSIDVPELYDEGHPKSLATLPPTAQTAGPNWLILQLGTPQENTFRITEKIFEFRLRSGDIGAKPAKFRPY